MDWVDLAVGTVLVVGVGAYLTALVFGAPLFVILLCAALVVAIFLIIGGVNTVGYSLMGLGVIALCNAATILSGIQGLVALGILVAAPIFRKAWRFYKQRRKVGSSRTPICEKHNWRMAYDGSRREYFCALCRWKTENTKVQDATPPQTPSSMTRQTPESRAMFCRECGAKIPRDSKFCEECGTNLT